MTRACVCASTTRQSPSRRRPSRPRLSTRGSPRPWETICPPTPAPRSSEAGVLERRVGRVLPQRRTQYLPRALAECALLAGEGLAVACVGRDRPGAALLAHLLAVCATLAAVRFGARRGWPWRAALGPAALVLALACV